MHSECLVIRHSVTSKSFYRWSFWHNPFQKRRSKTAHHKFPVSFILLSSIAQNIFFLQAHIILILLSYQRFPLFVMNSFNSSSEFVYNHKRLYTFIVIYYIIKIAAHVINWKCFRPRMVSNVNHTFSLHINYTFLKIIKSSLS